MAFDSIAAFLEMGGYALYVWPAYVITAVGVAFITLWPLRRHRRFLYEEAMRQRREQRAPGGARFEEAT